MECCIIGVPGVQMFEAEFRLPQLIRYDQGGLL
jgi:hypothetical protein